MEDAPTAAELAAPQDLKKLTVPQLKALCKERRIVGYSKLGKAALLQKLDDASSISISNTPSVQQIAQSEKKTPSIPIDTGPVPPTAAKQTIQFDIPRVSKKDQTAETRPRPGDSFSQGRTSQDFDRAQQLSAASLRSPQEQAAPAVEPAAVHPVASRSSQAASFSTKLPDPCRGIKRPVPDSTADTQHKKVKLDPQPRASSTVIGATADSRTDSLVGCSTAHNQSCPAPTVTPGLHRKTSKQVTKLPVAGAQPTAIALPHQSPLVSAANRLGPPPGKSSNTLTVNTVQFTAPIAPSGKRFRPLIPAIAQGNSTPKRVSQTQIQQHSSDEAVSLSEEPTLRYLDFPAPPPPVILTTITYPPRLSERKRVQRWAIILSALSDEDRRVCVFVSRTIRYAVYLSAAHILGQRYNGQRLKDVTQQYPQAMTNMWPYLRQRAREVLMRRTAFKSSFLGRYFQTFDPLSEHLWTSPDNERQVVIALRFVLTRLWFTLSVGGSGQDPSAWTRTVVEDVREIVAGEVWSVTVRKPTKNAADIREICYILDSTCEVIGHPPVAPGAPGSVKAPTGYVRADWSNYIADALPTPHSSATESNASSLRHRLKWANYEEFDRGISKLWLQRTLVEGQVGIAKREIAERYIMASVIGNSISGKWMSSYQMAQDFAGLQTTVNAGTSTSKSSHVNLYLPIHHHVESLHLVTSRGEPLHPSLAVVQTPGREYYILKDNGMQVGCEEEGIAGVWMRVLGCDNRGIALPL
ncbi:hypothetical protein BV22DRAFT_1071174 [Leucogyrophana mollusca]|uniref:Uncharacterized protein n=1 Tax=Leucogyrophana mollusca TaxID=85980 RepID=A0ACB8B897_9AGAM|nr:hypothetical protein BV22DRAFT_1071174 [Leucogyrophana mollusca]